MAGVNSRGDRRGGVQRYYILPTDHLRDSFLQILPTICVWILYLFMSMVINKIFEQLDVWGCADEIDPRIYYATRNLKAVIKEIEFLDMFS